MKMSEYFKEYYFFDKENPSRAIEVELYYNLGGINCFTGDYQRRGLYLLIMPVTKTEEFVEFTAFSGGKELVKEMKRKSDKQGEKYAEIVKGKAKSIAKAFYNQDNKRLLSLINEIKKGGDKNAKRNN